MKIRLDFVSNSSSSSFVFACNENNVNTVLKDIAKACVNKKDSNHDNTLNKSNLLKLEFCTSTYQLLFLGKLLLNIKKVKYSINRFKRLGYINYVDEFELYKKEVERSKLPSAPPWLKLYRNDEKIDDLSYWHYYAVEASNIVVSNEVMRYDIQRPHYENQNEDNDKTKKLRIESILKIAKKENDHDNTAHSQIDIYSITLDTIANTRDLIEFGYQMTFENWEDVDKIEKLLKSGNKVFYVRQADSSDGYGDFYIYCEDGVEGIASVSNIDIFGSEYL